MLAVALSLLRHVRHSYKPHTMVLAPDATGHWLPVPATPGVQTEPGLIVYRFGADLFYANEQRFGDEVRELVKRAPAPVRWLVVDAGAITALDYSAARMLRDLREELAQSGVELIFARVSPYLRADMDRHRIATALGPGRIFATLHEAVESVRGPAPGAGAPEARLTPRGARLQRPATSHCRRLALGEHDLQQRVRVRFGEPELNNGEHSRVAVEFLGHPVIDKVAFAVVLFR